MLYRCYNDKYYKYHRYGGRGIQVHSDWHSFNKFIEDMFPSYESGLTLDRIDNNLGYSKDNCQWLPIEVNSKKDMSKGVYKYTMDGDLLEFYEAMSDANESLGLNKSHGGMGRAIREKKPFKGYRWSRDKYIFKLPKEYLNNVLINMNVRVQQIDVNSGDILNTFKNCKEAAKAINGYPNSISNVCNGKHKTHRGYTWRYLQDV